MQAAIPSYREKTKAILRINFPCFERPEQKTALCACRLRVLPGTGVGEVGAESIEAQALGVEVDALELEEVAGMKVVVDGQGHARRGYGVGAGGAFVVVRPDGFVGAYVLDVRDVEDYFGSVLGVQL